MRSSVCFVKAGGGALPPDNSRAPALLPHYGLRLLRDGPGAQVEALLTSPDRATRRFAHRIAVARGLLTPGRPARLAAGSDDASLQDLCADAAIASMRDEDHDDVLGVLLKARNGRVRTRRRCGPW
ncbi:hypothetical protein [Streptomyces sp. OR43]|uniref:hypothetical protein n=1 Tax=Streptomyces sp. or43 TaxID=2478957 RepID=UPI0021C9B31A|nr:hypothetical protein [Streptomyces sp. or43]